MAHGVSEFAPEVLPHFVVTPHAAQFTCVKCCNILLPPVFQAVPCGCRICHRCLRVLFRHSETVNCPGDEEGCESITYGQTWRDANVTKALGRMLVFCSFKQNGCRDRVPWMTLKEHEQGCIFNNRQKDACVLEARVKRTESELRTLRCKLDEYILRVESYVEYNVSQFKDSINTESGSSKLTAHHSNFREVIAAFEHQLRDLRTEVGTEMQIFRDHNIELKNKLLDLDTNVQFKLLRRRASLPVMHFSYSRVPEERFVLDSDCFSNVSDVRTKTDTATGSDVIHQSRSGARRRKTGCSVQTNENRVKQVSENHVGESGILGESGVLTEDLVLVERDLLPAQKDSALDDSSNGEETTILKERSGLKERGIPIGSPSLEGRDILKEHNKMAERGALPEMDVIPESDHLTKMCTLKANRVLEQSFILEECDLSGKANHVDESGQSEESGTQEAVSMSNEIGESEESGAQEAVSVSNEKGALKERFAEEVKRNSAGIAKDRIPQHDVHIRKVMRGKNTRRQSLPAFNVSRLHLLDHCIPEENLQHDDTSGADDSQANNSRSRRGSLAGGRTRRGSLLGDSSVRSLRRMSDEFIPPIQIKQPDREESRWFVIARDVLVEFVGRAFHYVTTNS